MCPRLCANESQCVPLYMLFGWGCVYVCQKEQARGEKMQLVKQQWLAEKKPSTLNNQSSLLPIYSVLHYITMPLACRHLHIPVTSLRRLLIINGSHMLPGAPYYKIITATQKAKKNGNYVDMKRATKPIKRSAIIDSVSQSRWENADHLQPQVLLSRWQKSAGWGRVSWAGCIAHIPPLTCAVHAARLRIKTALYGRLIHLLVLSFLASLFLASGPPLQLETEI